MQHVKFPSIEQFRTVVYDIRANAEFHGTPLPTIEFHGTVKLHGTNASVVYDYNSKELYAQSRSQVITTEDDNAGFAKFVQSRKDLLEDLCHAALHSFIHQSGFQDLYPLITDVSSLDVSKVVIFGEWCGKGIQKGVAVTQLDPMFVIFGVKILTIDENVYFWLTPLVLKDISKNVENTFNHLSINSQIYCIEDFKTYEIAIDFSQPQSVQAKLADLTREVEQLCPVGVALGATGVGEGIVWTGKNPNNGHHYRFKTKGEKHADVKTKELVPVDIEKQTSIQAFVDLVITDHRLEKMLQKLTEDGHEIKIENLGEFLKRVGQDVFNEEGDTLLASNLDQKMVSKSINQVVKKWFITYIGDHL